MEEQENGVGKVGEKVGKGMLNLFLKLKWYDFFEGRDMWMEFEMRLNVE